MTPEEIRTEAIERLAVARREMDRHPKYSSRAPLDSWAALTEQQREAYRRDAARLADALGDLLPTGRSTRTLVYDPLNEEFASNDHLVAAVDGRESDYAYIAENWRDDGGRVVNQRRWTHEWQEVPE